MLLTSLVLSNVRNYGELEFEPSQGLNVFVGANAQGKSNLLEAIALLGTGKSFRTNKEGDLIAQGMESAAISGEARMRVGSVRLGCTIGAGARGTRKVYTVNGQSVRYAKFLGSLRVVTFVPADLQLVSGPPGGRRAFLNVALSQEQPLYFRDLARYHKVLQQKSALLRTFGHPDPDLLDIYNGTLVETGTAVMLARRRFCSALAGAAARVHAQWTGGRERLEVRYEPNVVLDVPAAEAVAAAFAARLRSVHDAELARKATLAGPHRDDLAFFLNGAPLGAYGSQGQQRTAVLALKVAEYNVMHERSGEAPLLLLDDVLSELDAARAAAFLEGVGNYEQAFITATQLPRELPPASVFSVRAGNVRAEPAAITAEIA